MKPYNDIASHGNWAPPTRHALIIGGMECVGVVEDEQAVQAHFHNGQTVQGDLLIGADGLHSQIRSYLHGAQPPTYAGYTAWRAVVPFDPNQLRVGESWGTGAHFGQIPMQSGRAYWFATQNTPAGLASPQGEKQALLALFDNWHAPIRALIEATPEATILRNAIYEMSAYLDKPSMLSPASGD